MDRRGVGTTAACVARRSSTVEALAREAGEQRLAAGALGLRLLEAPARLGGGELRRLETPAVTAPRRRGRAR